MTVNEYGNIRGLRDKRTEINKTDVLVSYETRTTLKYGDSKEANDRV